MAVFSEVEGNEVLLGLRRGGARLRPQKNEILFGRLESVDTASSRISSTPDISLRQPIQKNRKVKVFKKLSFGMRLKFHCLDISETKCLVLAPIPVSVTVSDETGGDGRLVF